MIKKIKEMSGSKKNFSTRGKSKNGKLRLKKLKKKGLASCSNIEKNLISIRKDSSKESNVNLQKKKKATSFKLDSSRKVSLKRKILRESSVLESRKSGQRKMRKSEDYKSSSKSKESLTMMLISKKAKNLTNCVTNSKKYSTSSYKT
jgi:hypothetical protein